MDYLLNYLASALDPAIGPSARLLALQCALRASPAGEVCLPAGLLRGIGLGGLISPWKELEYDGWLRVYAATARGFGHLHIEAWVLDAIALLQDGGAADRVRAADWALRTMALARKSGLDGLGQLSFLAMAAHTAADGTGVTEADRLARCCALPTSTLLHVLGTLRRKSGLISWDLTQEDVRWHLLG
ncbi:hypothetical protein ACFVJM_00345 [Streptomyces virginiae]|uniref:hypothetical protein n=1 Tax=Streptomyces virginiae TaxID=1961 RepID=UPI003643E2FD